MPPSRFKRSYRFSDLVLLAKAKRYLLFFQEDKADFIPFSHLFSDPFATQWEQQIKTAENHLSDETRMDIIAGHTQEIKQLLQNVQKAYHALRYFVAKAFPNNIGMQEVFQQKNFRSARQSPLKTIAFLKLLNAAVQQHRAELHMVGYQNAASLLQLQADLETAYETQQRLQKERTLHSQARNEAYNTLWATCQNVCRAAARVYCDNPIKRERYLLKEKRNK